MSYKVLTTADWHLRYTVPSCIDATPSEWMDIQRDALNKIKEIAIEHNVKAVYVGGDLYHNDEVASFECIQLVQDLAQDLYNNGILFFIFAGNHDLKFHSSSNLYRSAIGVTFKSKCVLDMSGPESKIKGCNFDIEDYGDSENIFKHTLTIPLDEKNEFIDCETPQSLLKKFPKACRIFTGDYHKNFYFEEKGRIVVNSGCLTKQTVDFEDYITGVYIVDLEGSSEDNYWVPVNIPQKFNHNGQIKKEIDQSVEKFATGIKKESITLDFISSLKNELPNHEKSVQDKVNQWIGQIGQ